MSSRPSRKAKSNAIENMSTPTNKRPRDPDSSKASSQETSESQDFQIPPKRIRVKEMPPKPPESTPRNASRRSAKAGTSTKTPTNKQKPATTATPTVPPLTISTKTARSRIQPQDEEGSLFTIVCSGRVALQSTIDEWIESYKQDRESALLNLMQFFISCSGCKGRITPDMYSSMEHADIIRRMTEEFDEDSGEYPLIMTGPQWKKFKSNFSEFVTLLVKQGQFSVVYDQYMMDNVISLLTGLTDSQVRAFRHTSTLAAMRLMTALVDVALGLSINLDNTQRQYEAERSKAASRRAPERLESLSQRRQELEENQEEIRNMLAYIFKGVFVHRYRDTLPEIRSICMQEIGFWMKRYPKMFLDDSYLKYVGWTIYDKVGDVRLQCLKSLQPLYESEELSGKLELFTNRFKDRIVEMTLDKEFDVAVQAVKLVISILRFNDGILTDKDCENVYELVYSSHRQVAQAAGEFLNTKLVQKNIELTKQEIQTARGKIRSNNAPLLRDLVLFFIESELHEHGAYLVDSLWDVNDMMKDWSCMTDLLLEEAGPEEESMDDRMESSLIEIMVCCVKEASTGEFPVGRGPATRKLSARDQRQVSEDKQRLTEHFIQILPHLLSKYGPDQEKAGALLNIPQYFDLEIYTSGRYERHLDELLEHINELTERHVDEEVLEGCAKCYEVLCEETYAIANRCEVSKGTLVDALIQKLKEAYTALFQNEEADTDDAFNLLAAMKRLYAYYSCHDLSAWNIAGIFFVIVKNGVDTPQINPEIMCKAVSTCSIAVMWHLHQLNTQEPEKDAMRRVKKEVTDFISLCQELLLHDQAVVCEEAFISICDLLVVFGRQLSQKPQLTSLMYEADSRLADTLVHFLSEHVFIDEQQDGEENQKIEELHKRRNLLASFCKLIVYNVLHIRHAAMLFQNYVKFYNDFGDIIKTTMQKAREINKIVTSKTMVLGLIRQYREVVGDSTERLDPDSEPMHALRELSRRFTLSFGIDVIKVREAIASIHQEGIQFALGLGDPETVPGKPPRYLGFLDVLCEFINKLMKQDRRTVLGYLDGHITKQKYKTTGKVWAALDNYRNLLSMDDEARQQTMAANTTAASRVRGRGRGRRGRVTHTAEVIETPAQEFSPPMASTAAKDGAPSTEETPKPGPGRIKLKIKSVPVESRTPSRGTRSSRGSAGSRGAGSTRSRGRSRKT